jgi:hypothetical protein
MAMVCFKMCREVTAHLAQFSSTVEWDVNVAALPSIQRHAIYGSTDNARRKGVEWRFQRFRFPYVHFEWHLQTPYSEVNARISRGANRPIPIKFLWKAWTRNQAASGV